MIDNYSELAMPIDLINEHEKNIIGKHEDLSNIDTPKFYVKDKNGMDYVEEGFMRSILNKHYPIWNWEIVKYEILGDKWIIVHGKLTIVDEGVPRYYDAIASHRIQRSKKTGDYVDIGNDMKSANSDAFKVALNRLCNIADDVYRKRVEDITLTETQIKEIENILSNVKDKTIVSKVTAGIGNMSINKNNFDGTIRKLKTLIKE